MPRLLNVSEHAFARMAQYGVDFGDVDSVLANGVRYYDPGRIYETGKIVTVLDGLQVVQNPETDLIITVIRSSRIAPRYVFLDF